MDLGDWGDREDLGEGKTIIKLYCVIKSFFKKDLKKKSQ